MSVAFHCDRDGCGTWIRSSAAAAIPNQFVAILDLAGHAIAHCCSLDCLMHWAAARSKPPETGSLEEAPRTGEGGADGC